MKNTALAADLTGKSTKPRPVIVIATNEGHVIYGERPEQCLSFLCLKSYLSHFRPRENEALNLSFVAALTLSLLEVCVYKHRRIQRVLTKMLKYFAFLAAFWLLASACKGVVFLRATRYIAMTSIGAALCHDFLPLFLRCWPQILVLSLLPAYFVTRFLKLCVLGENTDLYEREEEDRDGTSQCSVNVTNNDYQSSSEDNQEESEVVLRRLPSRTARTHRTMNYEELSFLGNLEGEISMCMELTLSQLISHISYDA